MDWLLKRQKDIAKKLENLFDRLNGYEQELDSEDDPGRRERFQLRISQTRDRISTYQEEFNSISNQINEQTGIQSYSCTTDNLKVKNTGNDKDIELLVQQVREA